MKKYFIFAVAALGLAACAEKGLDNGAQKGEVEESYVAITLAADDMSTKADDGQYEIGTDAEREVKSAYVFFFKDGAAFPVQYSDETTTNSGRSNYLPVALTGNTPDMPNVSDVKDAVLIIENYKGEYPNQIVAVLNWDPTGKGSYSLSELKTQISQLGSDSQGYVMSNSVYANANSDVIEAVDLKLNNIAKTREDALANPITIHVERIAAKVVFTAKDSGRFLIEKEIDGTPLYAQITGFELYNDYQESWLIKRIDPSWSGIGFNWNDSDWCRSYWANSLGKAFESNEFAYDDDNTVLNGYVYCGENTNREAKDRTKVIVKAEIQDAAGNAVEVVNWYGKDYIGEDKLLTVVANTIKNTYYTSTDAINYTGIEPADLMCKTRSVADAKAYEVYFQLAAATTGYGVERNWYKKNGDGTFTAIANDALNTELSAIQPALVYKEGHTYYYTDIKHLGAPSSIAEYGVVRNHVYKVNISDITGYGTPIYDPSMEFITPESPEDIVSYVSAQINILSWRLVAADYPLK